MASGINMLGELILRQFLPAFIHVSHACVGFYDTMCMPA